LGTAIAFLTGGIVAYGWLTLRNQSQVAALPSGAEVVPQDALLTLSLSTDEAQWQQLRQFGTPDSQKAFDQWLAQWRDRLFSASGYNYQRDIAPWVGGEVMIAFLPDVVIPTTQPEPSATESPTLPPVPSLDATTTPKTAIAIFPIVDPIQAQQIFAKRNEDAAPDTTQTYEGIDIHTIPIGDQTYAAGVIDRRFLVVATSVPVLQRAIDTYQNKTSLVDIPSYRESATWLTADQPFLRTYINIPAIRASTETATNTPIPPQSLNPLQDQQGLAATMSLDPDGVSIQAVSWLDADQGKSLEGSNQVSQMPTLLPDSTLVVVSGTQLQQLWESYSDTAAANTDASPSLLSPQNLRQGVQLATGLDLDTDFMPWMTGQFAVALVPIPDPDVIGGNSAGLVFLADVGNRNAAEETLTKLEAAMTSRYQFNVEEGAIADQAVTQWTSNLSGLTATRGWLGNNVAFLAIRSAVVEALLPLPKPSLAESPLFQAAMSQAPTSNTGFFFVNVEQLLNDESTLTIPGLPPDQKSSLTAVQALGVATSIANPATLRYDIRVILRQGNHPGALPEATDSVEPTPTDSPGAGDNS
jgi:hypothetical protein